MMESEDFEIMSDKHQDDIESMHSRTSNVNISGSTKISQSFEVSTTNNHDCEEVGSIDQIDYGASNNGHNNGASIVRNDQSNIPDQLGRMRIVNDFANSEGNECQASAYYDPLSVVSLSDTKKIDRSDDDLFRSALCESELVRPTNGANRSTNGYSLREAVVAPNSDLDDEEENPFKNAHLQPQLLLSGSSGSEITNNVGLGFNGQSSDSDINILMDKEFRGNKPRDLDDAATDYISIKVTKPRRIGEGISAYISYTVETKTNCNFFRKREFFVSRRFSDFLGLHDKLSERYLVNGRIIPCAPDKSVLSMTKIKMSSKETPVLSSPTGDTDSNSHDEDVERRRAALQRFLQRLVLHPSIRADLDFREFLELEAVLPRSVQTATLSTKNVKKIFSMVSDKVSHLALKMEETDEWFELKIQKFDAFELNLRRLHSACEYLVDYRKGLAHATGELAKSLTVLAKCEQDNTLADILTKLSRVEERVERIHLNQAACDLFSLSEIIKDYIGLVGAVKAAFGERVRAWQNWQAEVTGLNRRREAKIRAELSHKPASRIAELQLDIQNQERQVDMAQENFETVSRVVRKEIDAFEEKKAFEFRSMVRQYLEGLLEEQESLASEWEKFLPEIQKVST